MKAFDELSDLAADVIMAVLTTTASERKQLIVVLPIIFRLPIIFIMRSRPGFLWGGFGVIMAGS
jgi:hypothetical protein